MSETGDNSIFSARTEHSQHVPSILATVENNTLLSPKSTILQKKICGPSDYRPTKDATEAAARKT